MKTPVTAMLFLKINPNIFKTKRCGLTVHSKAPEAIPRIVFDTEGHK